MTATASRARSTNSSTTRTPVRRSSLKNRGRQLISDYDLIQRIDSAEDRWMQRIDEVVTRVSDDQSQLDQRINTVEHNLSEKINEQTDTVKQHIDSSMHILSQKLDDSVNKLDRRISVLERWRWVIIGGAAVVLFILADYLVQLWLPIPK